MAFTEELILEANPVPKRRTEIDCNMKIYKLN